MQDPPGAWPIAKASVRLRITSGGQKSDLGIVLITVNVPNQTITYIANNIPSVIHLPFKALNKVHLDLSYKRPIFHLYFAKKVAFLQFVRFKEWAIFAEVLKSLKNVKTNDRPFLANEHYQKIANQYLFEDTELSVTGETQLTDSGFDFDNEMSPKAVYQDSFDLDVENIELSTQ